jgi:hypothetical protein
VVLAALCVAAALSSLTLQDYVLRNYGGEGVGCRIARGLFTDELLCIFMSDGSRPIIETGNALVTFAATAPTVYSLSRTWDLLNRPSRLSQLFALGHFAFYWTVRLVIGNNIRFSNDRFPALM